MSTLMINLRRYYLLIFSLICFIFALLQPDLANMIPNYVTLITHPNHLIHDSFAVAGGAATFVNAALLLLFFQFLTSRYRHTSLNGMQTAAIFLAVGHSFFGVTLLNIIPIILGIYLYSLWVGQSFRRFVHLSIFSAGIGPIASYLLILDLSLPLKVTVMFLIGSMVGFVLPVLAEHFLKFHQGFSIYNVGFTTGIVAMIFTRLFPYFNLVTARVNYLSDQFDTTIKLFLSVVLISLLILIFPVELNNLKDLKKLFRRTGLLPDDFFSRYAFTTVILNMSLTGLVYSLILIGFGVSFSGPVLGALLSLIGFAAFGNHLFNSLPVSLGVGLAAYLGGYDLNSLFIAIPFVFSTSLAPITGYYGALAGLIAGFIHFNVAGITNFLHDGMTLYNNGFAAGFVAAFLVPVLELFDRNNDDEL